MSDTTFIYALKDPTSGAIRYIGKADDLTIRMRVHLLGVKREKNHKSNWIKSLLAKGLQPIMEVIDEVLKSEWKSAEAAYIEYFQEEGCNLVNISRGGDGFGSGKENLNFGKPLSDAVRAKLSAARTGEKHHNFGKKRSADYCAKIRAAHKRSQGCGMFGKKHSPETLNMMSGKNHFNFGKKHSPETIAKMRKAYELSKDRPPTAQAIANHIAAVHKPEYRAHLRAIITGKKRTPEQKLIMSAAQRKWRANKKERQWVEQCLAVMWR